MLRIFMLACNYDFIETLNVSFQSDFTIRILVERENDCVVFVTKELYDNFILALTETGKYEFAINIRDLAFGGLCNQDRGAWQRFTSSCQDGAGKSDGARTLGNRDGRY